MSGTISLGVWGSSPCESGAFDGIKDATEVAKSIAQAKWMRGESARITRADVMKALNK